MCGIVGLVNGHPVARDLVAALGRLEYRGYDSAGIAVAGPGFAVRKVVGRAADLAAALGAEPPAGQAGIAHTRWATHGRPEARNAHPHAAPGVAVVHNGVVENHAALRAELAAEGARFASDTDSEVIPHLIAAQLATGAEPEAALRRATARLSGAYAIAALFEAAPDRILVARRGSPLVVAEGAGCAALASDPLALAGLAGRFTALEEGETAVLSHAGVAIRAARPARGRGWTPLARAEAGPVAPGDHTRREIAAQPEAIRATAAALEGRVLPPRIAGAAALLAIGCGSSLHAALAARASIEAATGLPMGCEIASEFRDRAPPVPRRTALLLVSQSGETADTLAAMALGRARRLPCLGVVNVASSAIGRGATALWPTAAGAEIGVAATKSFTSQLYALLRLGQVLGLARGREDAALARDLASVPEVLGAAQGCEGAMREVAAELAREGEALFIGRGPGAALAAEGALKLKELSYLRAEGHAAGELKHGPIAMIREGSPVVVCAPSDAALAKTLANAQAVRARGARLTVLTDAAGAGAATEVADRLVVLPGAGVAALFGIAVALQFLAVEAATLLGHDADRPRNLAKSVTVE